MNLTSQIEAVLFVAGKPLSTKKLAKVLNATSDQVVAALSDMAARYSKEHGVCLFNNNDEWQLVSNPDAAELVEQFIKSEVSGELTRAQLEALTVIAYRGPMTRPELEQIRGVNCSLILRNLELRGLVQEREDAAALLPTYEVTMEYLRNIGLSRIEDLPDYETLHAHEYITQVLAPKDSASASV